MFRLVFSSANLLIVGYISLYPSKRYYHGFFAQRRLRHMCESSRRLRYFLSTEKGRFTPLSYEAHGFYSMCFIILIIYI